MPHSLRLLNNTITLDEALDEDNDILQELSYPEKRLDFYSYLFQHRKELEDIVSFHLGVPKEACKVAEGVREWVHGSFNACIPVYIDDTAKFCARKVFIRFPLPYKVGESQYPGNAEEKLRCEVATYAWIQKNCPDIPIPCLRGFGCPRAQSFTAPENAPLFSRMAWSLWRTVTWLFGYSVPSQHVGRRPPHNLDTGYMIVDCVEEGKMLSESWESLRHDQGRRTNLFKDLSRIILSLARLPFPRIGSLTMDNHGVLSLKNRPLTCTLQELENCGIPTDIPRNLTYSTSDAYLSDLLACHDNRVRYMPNSMHSISDAEEQLGALTMMRALLRHFTARNLRHGPFVLMLTDLHQSNIFVDSNWNITTIIDLEWACARPIEMQHPPYWLTGRSLDSLDEAEDLEAYRSVYAEFMETFEAEERSLGKADILHTSIMWRSWEVGSYWYLSALDCPKGLYNLYFSHIRGRFATLQDCGLEFEKSLSEFWSSDAAGFKAAKLKEKDLYTNQLRKKFEAGVN